MFFFFESQAAFVLIQSARPIANNQKIEVIAFYDPYNFSGYWVQAIEHLTLQSGEMSTTVHYQTVSYDFFQLRTTFLMAQHFMVSMDIQYCIRTLNEIDAKIKRCNALLETISPRRDEPMYILAPFVPEEVVRIHGAEDQKNDTLYDIEEIEEEEFKTAAHSTSHPTSE